MNIYMIVFSECASDSFELMVFPLVCKKCTARPGKVSKLLSGLIEL
jgi:hypothetical protein